ncbi:hypothetical protein KKA15_07015 [Patescibacteria group bacterium]|nr:hypothetical protein [Patescibacteria group bacterium]
MKGAQALHIFKRKIVVLLTFVLATVFLFAVASSALALDVGLDTLSISGLSTLDIRIIIGRIIQVALGLAGIIVFILVVYGGFVWMTSRGQPERIDYAKRILTNATVGLLIILLSLSIVTFVINLLQKALYPVSSIPNPPPVNGCINCDQIGGGIIESVYPEPGAINVPRNTGIFVTFKEDIDHTTIQDTSDCDVTGLNCSLATTDGEPNIKIYRTADGEDSYLPANEVIASRANAGEFRTYKFKPKNYLGDGFSRIWYSVRLENEIEKLSDGSGAFDNAAGQHFTWAFEVGTILDFDPPHVINVFPVPDNQRDTYQILPAQRATGELTISQQPILETQAQIISGAGLEPAGGASSATVEGSYNCSVGTAPSPANILVHSNDSSGSDFDILSYDQGGNPIYIPGLNDSGAMSGGTLVLGCGMVMVFNDTTAGGIGTFNWDFDVISQSPADTLRISNKIYRFICNGCPVSENDIQIGATLQETAQRIENKVDNDNLNVTASSASTTVVFDAVSGGRAGNSIPFYITGNWVNPVDLIPASGHLEGGADAGLQVTIAPPPDQPRNAIIRIDFSEAMDPTVVSGIVVTQGESIINAVGSFATGDFNKIAVQMDYDGIDEDGDGDNFDDDEYVAGEFKVSNQYKTVEFIPARVCVDEFGNTIENSCGDLMYCLPTAGPVASTVCVVGSDCDYLYGSNRTQCLAGECVPHAAEYRITIKAASLETDNGACAGSCGGCVAMSCEDQKFSDVVDTPSVLNTECVCGDFSVAPPEYFPVAALPLDGTTDAQGNSLNGSYDFDSNAMGPGLEIPITQNQSGQPAFNLNNKVSTEGDSLLWSFYVNELIDLEPPIILDVTPDPNEEFISLVNSIQAKFSKLLMSSTLKPDNTYRDGYCYCDTTSQCGSGQSCTENRCVNQGDQVYCIADSNCNSGYCDNKEYVTLINNPIKPSGYWISNFGLDELNNDGWHDRTVAVINHTPFTSFTNYGARAGSGILDIYQNCYLPGVGEGGCTSAVLSGDAVSCITISCEAYDGEECTGSCYDGSRYYDLIYSTINTTTCCPIAGTCL